MELMRDWLGPTIELQLQGALRWKEQGPLAYQAFGGVAYEDDGSNLRIMLKKAGHLQIVKFVKLENPITAVLSDSHSSIQAIFASSAVKAYTTKHRRRITDQTRGGIIAIAEYEIVATHLGPERSSVTLLVQTLHFGGCEGSAIFGRPVPVERRDRVDQLVQQLRDLRGLDVSNSPHHTVKTPHGTPSPVRSDVDSITSDDRSNGQDDYSAVETQVDFFSQIPRTGQIKSLKAGEPRKAQVPRQRPKTEHVTPRQLEAAPSMMPIECKSMTKHEKLIGLLHNQNPKATRPRTNQIMREPKEATVSEPKTSPESVEIHQNGAHISGSFENSGLTQSKPPESSSGDMIGNGHAEASPLLESSSISDRKATVAVFRENQADNESGVEQSKGQGKVLPASQRVRDATMAPIHGDVQDQVISNDGEVVEKHEQIHKDSEATQSEDKKDGEDIIDPWKGMTRIRRRDVRIPKDQQKLLDREDSWLPPEPGRRGPVANVPITALQALNSVAERRAIKSRLANGQEEVAELGVPEVHQEVRSPSVPGAESEGDSDEDQLSGWSKSSSPSAPGDQLPPDSSLEASVASPQVERRDSLAALGMNRGMLDDQTDSSRRTHDEISPLVASQLMADNASHDRELHANTSEQLIELSTGSSTLSGSRISQPLHQLEFHLRNAVSMNSAYSPAGQDAALVTKNTEEDFPSGLIHRNIDGELNSEEPNIHSVSQQSDMQGQMERPLFMDECSEEDDHSLESMVPIVVETGSPDQKLETSITPALPPPSTAPEAGQPLFQVKRTPYVDAEISKILQSRHSSRASSISGTDENAHHSARGPVSADDDMLSGSVVPSTHYSQIHPAGKVTSPPESGLDGSTDYVDLDDDALLDQQLHSEIDAHSQRSRSISPLKERAYGLVTGELEHELPLSLGRDPLHEIPPLAPVEDGEHGKRKAAELDQLSPFVTKRRKHIKAAPAFNFSQDNRQSQDPSLLARAHRRDFFTSRRLDTTTSTDKADENNTPKVEYARDSVGDGTQSWDLNPAHLVPMELDHHSCGTDTETLVSEAIPHKLNQHLAEQSSPLGSRFEISKKRRPATGISPAYSDSSKGSAGVRASTLPASKASPLAERSLYDVFTSTYQDYTGEFKHFLAMCYRIQALVQADRMEHRSLWDDFIVRHRTEYRDYLLDCTDRGEDPVAYEKFYGDEIEESKHTKRILTPASLKNFIASVAGASETDQHTRASTSPKKALDDTPSSVNPSVRRPTPKTTNQETIDLTVENRGSKDTLQSKSTPKQRRSLPWVESPNAAKVPSPSFTSKQTPTLPVSVQCSPSPHTPSHKSTAAQKAAQNPTSGRLRPGLDHPPTSSQLGEAHKQHPEANDSTRRLNRRESHPSSVAEWLDRSPSDTVSSPVSPSHNPTLNEGDEDRWYLDRNTPFKAFVREYAELKSVEGGLGEVDQEGILRTEMRQMDVLGWRL